ncbi:uncharacterized protein EDB91DRAFT_1085031 [Suillus paluster]|uniref:uncharacterized protein n=1 Tax=Suillus paluster TaxID=48578 RepID=UPI001B885A6E|nr:uncharacterized protein EDB91DRAFT_1085031 [Suillus paluster]KAG1731483.1 hypothetical protein EDB91DRAFT_1085031 [Suillus paluster]
MTSLRVLRAYLSVQNASVHLLLLPCIYTILPIYWLTSSPCPLFATGEPAQECPQAPVLDLAETSDDDIILTASTYRTVSCMHPATPSLSCIVTSESGKQQVVTGSYDGIARLWDLRITKGTVKSFKVWDGMNVLAVDGVGMWHRRN